MMAILPRASPEEGARPAANQSLDLLAGRGFQGATQHGIGRVDRRLAFANQFC